MKRLPKEFNKFEFDDLQTMIISFIFDIEFPVFGRECEAPTEWSNIQNV